MNGHQFKELLASKYGVEVTYWAPEAAVSIFRGSPAHNKEDAYQIALLALCESEAAFKRRIDGSIKDTWLSATTFRPIRDPMIRALEDVAKLEEQYPEWGSIKMAAWQYELLALLRTF